ncbi:MAG TPA: TonB-dependent siderophore receptor [Edaphobacter sp.]|uniref:TonB-dependent receptor n=1 Tax=Edaphobacter sp. TaxID=1934404 RepID=UPI002C424207|nr:TonB-dependent siderophore receptor [Edaphobacter sp.]HUZ96365.1 TonB-dependent siderophore receptor [Edaphobacter sp.]
MKRTTLKMVSKGAKKAGWKVGSRRGWLAMGTLAAYAVMGSSRGAMAAVTNDAGAGAAGAGAPAANLPVKRFHIGAGPLDGAIKDYEQVTGLTVKVTLPSATLSGFQTHGVNGLHTEEEGLRLLLEGTGLSYAAQDASTMVVGLRYSDSVDVTAAGLSDAVSMTKFTEPLIDTPQTVEVVPQFVLHDEGNSTLRDALRNVPGISMAAGESGAQGDNLTIRGFTARNDIFLDGIRDFGSYYRDSFNFDQVEVQEGPAGVQFGRGSTGGVINQESKVPELQKFVNVETQFGTDATRRITADINEPLTDVGHGGSAFRLNAVGQEGGVAGRPHAEIRRFGIAPSVSFGLNSTTPFTISYFHYTESDTPDYGLPWLLNGLAPGPIRHNYYGFPDQNYLRTNDDILTAKVSHAFGENVSLHSIARWANYPRQAQITEPQICSNASASVPVGSVVASLPTSAVNPKQPCTYTPASDPATIAVNRNQLQIKSVEGDLWDQTELTARFKVLGMRNDFDGGVEGGQEVSNPIRTSYTINKVNTVPSTNLLHPNAADSFGGIGYITTVVHTKSQSAGIYFVDTVHLGNLFELSGGVRWDYFDTVYNSYQPVAPPAGGTVSAPIGPISRLDKQPSYRAAFVYKPTKHGSVYFDYGTSFNPAAESLSLSVATTKSSLAPEENETYEVGAKYSLLNERLLLDGAWFRTEKDNAKETDPTNSNNIVNSGNQLVKGVQFSAVGRLPQGTDVVLGYAYLDSAVISSKFYPASVGYQLANVPKQTFNAFITQRLPLRLSAGLGGNYVASRTASSTVPYVPTGFAPNPNGPGYVVTSVAMRQVPGYWVFNAMMRRPVTDRLELQANIYNLLNRFYIDQPHPSHLIPGAGLSALIGVNFKF